MYNVISSKAVRRDEWVTSVAFGWSRVQRPVRRPDTRNESSWGFPQFLQTNSEIVPKIIPQSLLSDHFPLLHQSTYYWTMYIYLNDVLCRLCYVTNMFHHQSPVIVSSEVRRWPWIVSNEWSGIRQSQSFWEQAAAVVFAFMYWGKPRRLFRGIWVPLAFNPSLE